MDRRSLLAKLGGRFIPMIWVVLDFLEPTCSIFVFFLIFIDNVSVFLCGFGVGGHGSYMCEESWCDYQGRVHHGSYLGTFTIFMILWHFLTISFHFLLLTASHCGHDIFDSSCVLARVSLVHGFYSIRGSQHLVFDYASGGLQNILPRPSSGGKFCFGNVLLDMDLDSVYYLPGCSCNLFWFGCGTH